MEISKMEISKLKWKFPVEISRNFHFGNCVLEISIRRGKGGLDLIHTKHMGLHTKCMAKYMGLGSLIHFVWGFLSYILYGAWAWKF